MNHIKEEQKTIHVVFVGESGFPRGLATIQRLTLMAKALLFVGAKTTVLCRKGVHNERDNIDFGKSGVIEGIGYEYTSPGLFKPKGFIKRNFDKLLGIWGEFATLSKLKSESKVDALIVSEMKVIHILRYWLCSKVIGVVMIANLVEMTSSMQHRKGLLRRLNDFILDKWVIRLYDGAMPISDILCEYYGEVAPHKPFVKVPIVCDFDKFKKDKTPHNPYFLYCGSFRYKEVRDFVIESYKRVANNEAVRLYMIVSGGSKKETLALEAEVNTMFKTDPVRLFSNIPYSELVDLYVNADALLIPLRPTIQDSARFPHKIGEYLASGNPVITTNIGEIKNYFQDQVNALVADKYEAGMFAEKMKFVIDNPIKAIKIGHQGQQMGWQNFDYRTQGKLMRRFIENLVNKNDKTST